MIDEKTNLDKNLSTNKTYVRVKNDQDESIQNEIDGILTDTEKTPLSDDEDEAWE